MFGYAKLLLQQLNLEDVGGELECGGTGLDECTAKIIEMAYGRDMNIQGQLLGRAFLKSACQLLTPSELVTSVVSLQDNTAHLKVALLSWAV